jgi:hypothetical protein
MCLQARREGKCEGVVTYCLDKSASSRTFAPVQQLFRDFGKAQRAAPSKLNLERNSPAPR